MRCMRFSKGHILYSRGLRFVVHTASILLLLLGIFFQFGLGSLEVSASVDAQLEDAFRNGLRVNWGLRCACLRQELCKLQFTYKARVANNCKLDRFLHFRQRASLKAHRESLMNICV